MSEFIASAFLLFALLNPFLMVVYLIDLMQKLDQSQFRSVLFRACVIASAVFCCFVVLGDAVFSNIIQAEFASFQIFGGLVFVLIGLQFVFKGPSAIEILRGESAHLAGAVAMPVMIGPGTISASVVIGERLDPVPGCAAVLFAVAASTAIVVFLKWAHDYVRPRREPLIQRYIEIAGRITALYIGTVAIDMIMKGTRTWLTKF